MQSVPVSSGGRQTGFGRCSRRAEEVVLAAATDKSSKLFDEPDAVGAYPIHAVTVANTDDAIVMSGMLLDAKPELLTQVHGMHRAGFPLFAGESSLHICCVNKRVDLLNKMIEIAHAPSKRGGEQPTATDLRGWQGGLQGMRVCFWSYSGVELRRVQSVAFSCSLR